MSGGCSSWAEVDLATISGNVSALGRASQAPVMAVVKANAYGHGALPVAQAALRGGATWLGVARVEEGLALAQHGLQVPILVMGWTPSAHFADAVAAGLRLTVWDHAQIGELAEVAAECGPVNVHLKVDTGMSRLGARAEQVPALLAQIAGHPSVRAEGLFTHYACADDSASVSASRQSTIFAELVGQLQSQGLRPPVVHAANSAAALRIPQARWDLVRFGIALYGLSPGADVRLPDDVRPALTWKSVLSQVKQVPPGAGISYGHTFTAQHEQRIGTVPLGYADGLRRTEGNTALVGGVEVSVLGRVCMDQLMLDLDDVPQARVGDEVVFIGGQGERWISADDMAARWGTIGYEVVCGIGARVERRYA